MGSPTTPPTGGAAGGSSAVNDPKVQQQLLAEEEQAMAKYKEQHKVRIISLIFFKCNRNLSFKNASDAGNPCLKDILEEIIGLCTCQREVLLHVLATWMIGIILCKQ